MGASLTEEKARPELAIIWASQSYDNSIEQGHSYTETPNIVSAISLYTYVIVCEIEYEALESAFYLKHPMTSY